MERTELESRKSIKIADMLAELNSLVSKIQIRKGNHGEFHNAVNDAVKEILQKNYGLSIGSWKVNFYENSRFTDVFQYTRDFEVDKRTKGSFDEKGKFSNIHFTCVLPDFDINGTLGDLLKQLRINELNKQIADNVQGSVKLHEQLAQNDEWLR